MKQARVTIARIGTAGTACATLLACAFFGAAVYFALLQNVWIDESTQLSGAALPLARMLAWLAGGAGPAIAVPPDRAPPVSYLLDAACGASLCRSVLHFRLLHLFVTLMGAALLLATVARRFGGIAAAAGAAVLFLSPKLVEVAVEIRSYPVFFALTCVQIVLLAGLVDGPRVRIGRLLPFAGVGLLAIYTHFFGLVSTMALFGGLFAARARDRREGLAIGGAAAGVLALSAGLQPFVAGANAISQTPLAASDTNSLVQFALKLLGHSATLLSLPVALFFFAGFAVMIAVAAVRVAWRSARGGWRGPGSATFALIVALLLGLAATFAASALLHGFDPLKTAYSIWVFPVLAWLAGAACAPAGVDAPAPIRRWLIPVARGAAAVFALAALAAQALFLAHAQWFVHGPGSAIAAAAGPQPNGVAVVYRGAWGYGYFPTLWRYRDRMRQSTLAPDGTVHRVVHAAVDPRGAAGDPFAGDRRVVMVDIATRGYRDLRPLLAGAPASAPMPPAPAPPGFAMVKREVLPGLYWTTVSVFERRDR